VCINNFLSECSGAEIIVSFDPLRTLKLGRSLNVTDLVLIIFKVVTHHQSSVILKGPWTKLGNSQPLGIKRPFDCLAENTVSIHSRSPASMPNQRLHCSAVDNLPFAVRLYRKIWSAIPLSQNGCITDLHLPNGMGG